MNAPRIEGYFACIGAQKAGTTWLARVLSRHPDIFVTPVKEIHYFDHVAGLTSHLSERKRRSRYRKYHQRMWTQWNRWGEHRSQRDWYRAYMQPHLDDAWYASLFAQRHGEAVAGEATPEYALIGREGFAHMKTLAPDARVIYIMRNPITRAWSQLLHQCRARKLHAAALTVDDFLAIASEDRFEALADYERVLDDVASEFPSEHAWLAYYEDIHSDRAAAVRRICEFLGVSRDGAYHGELERRFNISQSAELPAALHDALREKYARLVDGVARRMGHIPAAWESDFNRTDG